jgi:hypothetical protein
VQIADPCSTAACLPSLSPSAKRLSTSSSRWPDSIASSWLFSLEFYSAPGDQSRFHPSNRRALVFRFCHLYRGVNRSHLLFDLHYSPFSALISSLYLVNVRLGKAARQVMHLSSGTQKTDDCKCKQEELRRFLETTHCSDTRSTHSLHRRLIHDRSRRHESRHHRWTAAEFDPESKAKREKPSVDIVKKVITSQYDTPTHHERLQQPGDAI